jgi:hypothetical protein
MRTITIVLLASSLLCLPQAHSQAPSAPKGPAPAPGAPANAGSKPGATNFVSAEKTSFQQVTSQLDPGGNAYIYLSTEQLLEGLSTKIGSFRELIGNLPDMKERDRENIYKVFDVVTNLVRSSGIEQVSGFGFSAIALDKEFYRTKAIVHHYKDHASGFGWSLFGQRPHELEALNMLPTNTVAAMFSDFDLPLLWSVIQKQVSQSRFPKAERFLETLPQEFEKGTGLKWDQVLASLGGEFGVALMLNPDKKVSIPLPSPDPLEIPEPSLLLVIKVKDDTIFNRIDKALGQLGQQVVKTDKPNLKIRSMPLPLPLPVQLSPTIASTGGYLLVASNDRVIEDVVAVKAGERPGLKSTDEFKQLAKDIPQQGNQLTFLSRRFSDTINQLQKQILAMNSSASDKQKEFLQSFLTSQKPAYIYNVAAQTEEGWVSVGNGNQHPAKLLLASSVAPVAIAAAIALPALAKAKEKAKQTSCIANLRQIEVAKQTWALENKKAASAVPTEDDLREYLKAPLSCPSGGTYTLNAVSEPPECSVPGHVIRQ